MERANTHTQSCYIIYYENILHKRVHLKCTLLEGKGEENFISQSSDQAELHFHLFCFVCLKSVMYLEHNAMAFLSLLLCVCLINCILLLQLNLLHITFSLFVKDKLKEEEIDKLRCARDVKDKQ